MKQPAAGYVALIAVLVVGALSLAVASALLLNGVDSQRAGLALQQSIQARSLTSACAEEALQQMRDSTAYTGSGSVTLTTGSCSYTVTSTGSTTRTVDATSSINGVVRKLKLYVTISSSSVSVTSWQEVS